MKTVKSGIDGMDDVLNDGFTKPSVILLSGLAGTGKTTFAMQSLFNSAKFSNEKVLYISAISEPLAQLNNYMSKFTFFDSELFEKKNMHMVNIEKSALKSRDKIIKFIEGVVEKYTPDRVVIDPINVFDYELNDMEKRIFWYELFTKMKGWDALIILTAEFGKNDLNKSIIGYLVDGIIHLSNEGKNSTMIRYLDVVKMRGQKYLSGKHIIKFTDDGLKVILSNDEIIPSFKIKSVASTGIKVLDEKLGGGIPLGSSFLLTTDGLARTTLISSSILTKALESDFGVVVAPSSKNSLQRFRDVMEVFGVNITKFAKDGKLIYLDYYGRTVPKDLSKYTYDFGRLTFEEFLQKRLELIKMAKKSRRNWILYSDLNSIIRKFGEEAMKKSISEMIALFLSEGWVYIGYVMPLELNERMSAFLHHSFSGIIHNWIEDSYQYIQIRKSPYGLVSKPMIVKFTNEKPFIGIE